MAKRSVSSPRSIYYGWYLLAASILINLAVIGTTSSAFALYVKPVSGDLGLSRATMNTALILINVGMAASGLVLGRMIDRWPLRPIIGGCGLLAGACLFLLGVSNSVALNAFVLLVPLTIGMVGGCTLSVSVLLARWFVAHRGRAFALWTLGMSLSNVTTIPVIAFLIAEFGWREALMASGLLVAACALLMGLVVRDRPGPDDIEPGIEKMTGRPAARGHAGTKPLTMGQVARIPEFWMLAFGIGIGIGVITTFVISAIPFATDLGYGAALAASLLSFKGVAAIVGKLSMAIFADKVDRSVILIVFFLVLAAANAVLLIDHSYATLAVCCTLVGFVIGAAVPAYQALVADRFGTVSLGTVRGMVSGVQAPLSAICIRFSGEVYDRTGNYTLMFVTFAIAATVAAMLILGIRFLPTPAEQAGDPEPPGTVPA